MKTDNVHILYGINVNYKIKFLKNKIKEFNKDGFIVIDNLYSCYDKIIDYKKLKHLDVLYPLYKGCTEVDFKISKGIIKHMWDMIVLKGDYLVINEPDIYFKSQKLIDFMGAINYIVHLWKEIWISGTSEYLIRAVDDNIIYVIESDESIIKLEHCDVFEYFDTL